MSDLPNSFYRAERDWLEEPDYVSAEDMEAAEDAYCDACYERQRDNEIMGWDE